ncbi:MAG TPA: queuosine salvage family protein [bacterium]
MASSVLDFTLARPDSLEVLTTTAPAVQQATHVRLDGDAVLRFAAASEKTPPPVASEDALHCTFLPPKHLLNYLLVLEALNFCFWDEEPRWRVAARDRDHDGYWALTAALYRAIRENAIPVWDAQWMAEVDERQMAALLRGTGRPIPLLAARVANVREAGEVLLARWRGEFANVVHAAGGDASVLVKIITREFKSFHDVSQWSAPDGTRHAVRFLKRAQICVADLARLLPDHPLGQVTALTHLTAFADYKVPQVLRKLGMLVYAQPLAERVDAQQELVAGSPEEVEIRAATIWACEWIARALALRQPSARITASDVDYRLWLMGQDKAGLKPYHRTRTIYY